MRALILIPALALLAACADEPTPAEQAAQAERELALVEKGNAALPPPEPVDPQPILYPDIERQHLAGAACSFAPGTSLAASVIAREEDAWMKIKGEMIRFAADSGSPELAPGAHVRYLGKTHELRLTRAGKGGTATLLDEHGRTVYQASGTAQCGG